MPIVIDGKVYRNLEDQVKYLTDELDDVKQATATIPSDASLQNKLTTRAYVDQAVTTVSAHYLTSDATGNNFPTKAALLAGPYYYGGGLFNPTFNDYAFVNADEDHDNLPSRYVYIDDQWQYQYSLQASGGVVDLTSAQTITGVKTFINGFKILNSNLGIDSLYNADLRINGETTWFNGTYFAPSPSKNPDFGTSGYRWHDLYLSGKIDLGNNAKIYLGQYNNLVIDGGNTDTIALNAFTTYVSNLNLSGNIEGSYKEANQVVAGSGGLRTAQFNMDATTVNKIKYLEIYMADGTQLYTHMLPVAAWNMSEWLTARTITTPMMNISVMYSSGVLYVAVPDSADYEVQVFAKMI